MTDQNMEITSKEEENNTGKIKSSTGSESDIIDSGNNPDGAAISVRRAVTGTGFRVSMEIKQEIFEEPEDSAVKLPVRVKEEPDLGYDSMECEKESIVLGSADTFVPDSEFLQATNSEVAPMEECLDAEITKIKEEPKEVKDDLGTCKPEVVESEEFMPAANIEVTSMEDCFHAVRTGINVEKPQESEITKLKEEPKDVKDDPDTCKQEVVSSDSNQTPVISESVKEEMAFQEHRKLTEDGVGDVKGEPEESEVPPKEETNVSKTEEKEVKSEANRPHDFPKDFKDMTFKEYCAYREGRSYKPANGIVKQEPDVVVVEEKPAMSNKPKYVKKEPAVEVTKTINGVKVETEDFPEEKDWYLVGGTMVTGLSTSKGRKLVDNEIVQFVFPNTSFRFNSQWIVRFSTKRSGEIGRLPMEWGKCVVPLVNSKKVKVLGRCVAAPPTLHIMQEIILYVSFYIHSSIFTELDKSTWRLEANSNIDSTIYPLLTLFKLLKITPYQKAEFTPQELDSRKRSLNLEDDATDMLPLVKRGRGCQQYPEQNKDEEAVSESSINKLVGAADMYNLEEMEPPRTLMCSLRPYQKQALYWMSECEKGIDAEKAAKTQHPCWAAYRICDARASSIYLNIFSGEATTQFPAATQMARGGILADAMGLGKTVMTISLILARPGKENSDSQESKNMRKAKGGTLIVCPMALLGQWKDELETHSEPESISIFVHYGGYRTNDPRVICGHDVVFTTYGVLTAAYKSDLENSIFHKVDWYRVVLDEAHTIKSWKTVGAQAAFKLSSHCRWCLTGTPLQNNLEDLYSLLCFLHVEPWCNWVWWSKLIQRPYENGDPRGMKLIKAILRPLMLRRTKETKDKEGRPILVLPPTDIQIIECEHSEAERDFYDALFKRSKVQFDQFVAQGKVLHNYASILELLLRLRQCCNHPFLVLSRADSQQYSDLNKLARRFLETNADSVAPGQTAPTRAYIEEVVEGIRKGENSECPICMEYADDPVLTPCAHRMCRECLLSSWRIPTTGVCPICRTLLKKSDLITCPTENKFRVDVEKNWKESSKVSKLLECLDQIRRSGYGDKSIIFSQWTSFLDLLEIPLRRRGIGFLRFDGKLVQKQRERTLKEFNETKEKMVLLMSLKAGGVGLNLTAASNVFLLDPWWNPAVEEQAIMRIHRIGQKRTVTVRRFIVKETVEERLQQVQARKQRMIAGALTDEEVRSARIEELKMLFR